MTTVAQIVCFLMNLNSAYPTPQKYKILSFGCVTKTLKCMFFTFFQLFHEKYAVTMATVARIFRFLMDLNSAGSKTPIYKVWQFLHNLHNYSF